MRTLDTERLILKDWELSDLDDYYAIMSNPAVAVSEGSMPSQTKDACLPILQYFMQAKNNYALVLKETGHVIGSVGLNEDADGNQDARNVGFMLEETYWNRGLMTEALRAIIANAAEITSILSCGHTVENAKTKHIIEKLGFKYVKTFHDIKKYNDAMGHDLLYYTLRLR